MLYESLGKKSRGLESFLRTASQQNAGWFLLVAVLLALQVRWWWDPGIDSAAYLSMARHMAHGQLQCFGSYYLPHPPGYPLLIAPLFWVSDRPFLLISLVHWLLAVATAGGVYLWLRRLDIAAAAPMMVLVMVNVGFWRAHRRVLSETAFMAELIWAAHVLYYVAVSRSWTKTPLGIAVAVPLLVFTCFTRHVGIFLVAGFALAMFMQVVRRREPWGLAIAKTATIGLPVVAALIMLIAWDDSMRSQAGHLASEAASNDQASPNQASSLVADESARGSAQEHGPAVAESGASVSEPEPAAAGPGVFASSSQLVLGLLFGNNNGLGLQIADGVRREVGECGRLLLPGLYKAYSRKQDWLDINNLTYGVFGVFLALGWWLLLRRQQDLLLWTFPFYIAFLVIVPWDANTRYLVPMLPVLWASTWPILQKLWRPYSLLCLLLAAHCLVSLGYWAREFKTLRWNQSWAMVDDAAAALGPDAGAAGLYRVPFPLACMLQLEANRELPTLDEPQAVAPSIRRLISTSDEPPPAGFHETAAVGDFKLLRR